MRHYRFGDYRDGSSASVDVDSRGRNRR